MIREHLENLVLDVVLSQADEGEVRRMRSGATVLDVDQLTMTHIVLALETQLGVELPTYLEDARTLEELLSGTRDALRDVQAEGRSMGQQGLPLASAVGSALA